MSPLFPHYVLSLVVVVQWLDTPSNSRLSARMFLYMMRNPHEKDQTLGAFPKSHKGSENTVNDYKRRSNMHASLQEPNDIDKIRRYKKETVIQSVLHGVAFLCRKPLLLEIY